MIDIKLLRENPDLFTQAAKAKNFKVDINALLEADRRILAAQQELQQIRTEQNQAGKDIPLLQAAIAGKMDSIGKMTAPIRAKIEQVYKTTQNATAPLRDKIKEIRKDVVGRMSTFKVQTKKLNDQIAKLQGEFDSLMLLVAQPADPDVPVGQDDTENVEIRKVGKIRKFDFAPKDHVELGKSLDIIDIERGVKLSGSRNYVMKGAGAMLYQATLRLAMDMMLAKGYTPLTVPVLVRNEVMTGTGWFPVGRDQAYLCERDGMSLAGTAEVPLTAYHAEEILQAGELPKKYVAMSACYRREAGAAGKDTYGLYRIHSFDKVEQFILAPNDKDQSIAFHQEILANSEDVMQTLGLPYRVVNVCTGDLGQGPVQKFDIETWMPSRDSYGETHSASRFYEFQSRRLNIRYRDIDGKVKFCHTLN
ncbi:MAG: serine--tRNA ligase, partial [Phycisphaerae bacterium]|nr:serine--tRNA ligase [Phycisphaerae bacterium]